MRKQGACVEKTASSNPGTRNLENAACSWESSRAYARKEAASMRIRRDSGKHLVSAVQNTKPVQEMQKRRVGGSYCIAKSQGWRLALIAETAWLMMRCSATVRQSRTRTTMMSSRINSKKIYGTHCEQVLTEGIHEVVLCQSCLVCDVSVMIRQSL